MILAIIQARMGSTRLPGKVLKKISGKVMMEYQLDRIKKSKKINKVVVATSSLSQDDAIENFCKDYGVDCFRGTEDDVLSRYYLCARQYNPETIVRLTADCPLVDPVIIDNVIEKFEQDNSDYCSNTTPLEKSTFPDGTDVEVFSMKALEKANYEVDDPHFREHVTFQFWRTKEYASSTYMQVNNQSKYRFTVDYPEDFEVVSYIINKLSEINSFGCLDNIIAILDSNDDIREKNSQYYAGQGWNIS